MRGRETYARTRRSIERLRIVLLFNSDRVIDLAVSFSPCREAVRIRVTLRACVRGQLGRRIACKGAANRRERARRRIRSFNEFDMEGPSLLAIFVIHGTSRLGGSAARHGPIERRASLNRPSISIERTTPMVNRGSFAIRSTPVDRLRPSI